VSRALKKIRALVVDDEPIAREGIRMHVEQEPDVEIVCECANGLDAVRAIEEYAPDLVFLDVQMPGLDGFGVLEAVGVERMPAVVFVTAYDRYALKAFEVHALDYLLKPFDAERFQKAMGHARRAIQDETSRAVNTRLLALIENLRQPERYLERLVIKTAGRIFFMSVDEIDWIEAADNYVKLHSASETHLLRETVNNLESRLDPQRFVRIRRSTIVSIDRIKELRPITGGEYSVLLKSGVELVSSRRYRGRLANLLGD
jgi:two-component system LytT family response regulator